ncbi:MAG: 2-succinyl-5-enolpyruvyl-6-hydroxy-3-cyclohexene-1-carboxylic-acid synthase [Chlorobiaceae bacterium]|nr:2-succinyl-5-enolpyruvyl-6-hydroxy-3-cyclohexene-1-carboxylic-acid synthase [Chlorobiaceae bacterium]
MNNRQVTTLWSQLLVEEFIRQGAGFFCISPGSRSTPLTIAIARHPGARFRLFPDERSAGFYALGYSRATGMPAILVCTSGTAVANYLPAVVEASADARPMIVLSADRPFELLEAGANQTIRQQEIFGNFTRWSFQLPAPDTCTPLASLLSTAGHAVRKSLGSPAGPVHLNVPFREPLVPEAPDLGHQWVDPVRGWLESGEPWNRFEFPVKTPSPEGIDTLREILESAENPLFVAGSIDRSTDADAVEALALSLGIPLFADLTSGIRMSGDCRPWQLAFQSEAFTGRFRPDAVIHFGGPLIGKQPGLAIRNWKPRHYAIVREHPERFGEDHNVTLTLEASPSMVADALAGSRKAKIGMDPDPFFEAAALTVERTACAPEMPVNEISAARITSRLIGKEHGLFVSNSMPARDMDTYAAPSSGTTVPIALNRGVSGIDGIISTAAGFSAGLEKPVALLIGDLSFLHDLNALSLLNHAWNRVVVIVLNNGGGGIFSFLPVSTEQDVFEACFATPQSFSVSSAAETFGLGYANPRTNREFAETLASAMEAGRSTIIEVTSSREENLKLHQSLKAATVASAGLIKFN